MEENLNLEYLPDDPNEKELKRKEKTEKKLKEFREYIVNKGVVLAFTKGKYAFINFLIVLLSLKYSEVKPKNPNRAIREFFGKYYDPQIEMQNSLQEEILILRNENPKLMEKVLELEEQLVVAKRKHKIKQVYQSYDPDPKTQLVSTKQIVEKLSGDKKFTVDEKLSLEDFNKLLENVCEGNTTMIDLLINNLEISTSGNQIYKDDSDNPVYKKLIQIIQEMKKQGKK